MSSPTPSSNTVPLVSCAWLAERLDDPDIRIIEVTSAQDDAGYKEGHIPGAVWWYWKNALWHATDRQFATPQEMARRLGAIGVSRGTTVVMYGVPVQFGTYAFWVLTMCGHPDVRILDGGKARWTAEGRPLTAATPAVQSAAYTTGNGDPSSRIGRDDVLGGLGKPGRVLLDVRSIEEYRGERVSPPPNFDHGAERAGRIPGATHLFYRRFLNDDDTFRSVDDLRSLCAGVASGLNSADEIVTYCRLSHRATLAWFALRYLLEYANVRIYDGSWTEWGSIIGFPVER